MIREATNYRASAIEDMLDRYGLAYICRNPLVLFGERPANASDPPHVAYGQRLFIDVAARGYEDRDYSESLSRRVREAYDILEGLYTPWPAQYAGPRDLSYGHAEGHPR